MWSLPRQQGVGLHLALSRGARRAEMHAGRKRSWAQARRRGGGGSGSDDDLDMRVGGGGEDSSDDEQGDVGSMSAQQLRSWLTARGADHELCEDHADLVRARCESAALRLRSHHGATRSWRSRARWDPPLRLPPTTSRMRWTRSWRA